MKEFINQALALGQFDGTPVRAVSNPWKVTLHPPCSCICQQVRTSFHLEEDACGRGDCCIQDCYVYHTGSQPISILGRWAVRAGYGIWLKYADCHGESHIVTWTGSILFSTLPPRFSPRLFSVCLQNPVRARLDRGCAAVDFRAVLCAPLEELEAE